MLLGVPWFRDMSRFPWTIEAAWGKLIVLPGHKWYHDTSIDFTLEGIQEDICRLIHQDSKITTVAAYSFAACAALRAKEVIESTWWEINLTLINPAIDVLSAVSSMSSWVEGRKVFPSDIIDPTQNNLLEWLVQSKKLWENNTVFWLPDRFREDLKNFWKNTRDFSQLWEGITCFINPYDRILFPDWVIPNEGTQKYGSLVKYLPGREFPDNRIILGHMINKEQWSMISRYLQKLH